MENSRRSFLLLAAGAATASAQQTNSGPAFRVMIEGNTFVGNTIELDNGSYTHCDFRNCTLRYGGGPLRFTGNRLVDSHFLLVGAAARTAALMQNFGPPYVRVEPPDDRSPV